jgi:hypothetical protein
MADVHYGVTAERHDLRLPRYASRAPNATEIGNSQFCSRSRGPISVSQDADEGQERREEPRSSHSDHVPLKAGGRLAVKARTPSAKSSV